MAVNQGGSQAVVLQLEFFCVSSSVSFSLSFLVFNRWHSTYQEYVKTVYSALLPMCVCTCVFFGGGTGGLSGGKFTLCCCCWTRASTRTHTHTQQMVQEGGLNKHTCTDTHLLADRRLCVRCPLMNVYWESEGPSSFSWLSMRCSIMTMVIRSSLLQ